jgi:NADH-quinone oxidoreductase subunit L
MSWMLVGLTGLSLPAALLGPALPPLARLVGQTLPTSPNAQLLGLTAAALGLLAGWSGLADRLVAPISIQAARGFRVGDGWIGLAVRPALVLAYAANRLDRDLHEFSLSMGRRGLALASATRYFEEADLDGLIRQLVRAALSLGAGARRLQTGFVSRELLLAAAGAALILVLALAVP